MVRLNHCQRRHDREDSPCKTVRLADVCQLRGRSTRKDIVALDHFGNQAVRRSGHSSTAAKNQSLMTQRSTELEKEGL